MKYTQDTFKAILKRIQAVVKPVEGSEDEFASLFQSLASDGRETLQDLTTAETEAITRKKKIKVHEDTIQDQIIEIEKYKEAQQNDKTGDELKALREFKTNAVKSQIGAFGKNIEAISSHANFDKAKKFFILPEPDKDGKYDFSKMSEADLTANLSELEKLNDLGYFGESGNSQDQNVDVDGNHQHVPPKGFDDKLDGAKNLKDLEKIQESLN